MLFGRDQHDNLTGHIAVLDYSVGDAEFLTELPRGACVLRPVLKSELPQPDFNYPPGVMLLFCRSIDGFEVRAIVKMPAFQRKTTRANVRRAISQIREMSPMLAGCASTYNPDCRFAATSDAATSDAAP